MKNETNPKIEPNGSPSRILFLFIAFLPTALILISYQGGIRSADSSSLKWILYGVNPVVALFASLKVFDRPEIGSVDKIVSGFILGLAIAVLNGVIGCFAGCLCAVTNTLAH